MSSSVATRLACLFTVATSALAGCASTYPTKDNPPPRDFSVGVGGDMASGVGGNGGNADMASGGGGSGGSGGGADMAAMQPPLDMALPVAHDLMPACATSIADDAGVAPGLHLAAPGPGHQLWAARFDGHGWNNVPTTAGAQLADVNVAVAGTPGVPLVVARTSDSELFAASWDGCYQQWPALARVRSDAWTALRPAVAGNAAGADVVFRGGFDKKIYWSHFDGTSFSVIATDGNLLSDQIPTALYIGGALHTIYNNASQSQAIYDGTVQASGGNAAALGGNSNFEPAAASTGNDAIVVFTGYNQHVYWFKDSAPATLHDLCDGQTNCYILAEAAPAITLGSDGSAVCVFRGTDHHLYSTSLAAGASTWTPVLPLTGTTDTTQLQVALAPGLDGTVAEAVYVQQGTGYPRHARLSGNSWSVSTVENVALTGAAALALAR